MEIKEYIFRNYKLKQDFAKEQGVSPDMVSRWIAKGYLVVDGKIYSPLRELIAPIKQVKE